jgi:hypothetical protein
MQLLAQAQDAVRAKQAQAEGQVATTTQRLREAESRLAAREAESQAREAELSVKLQVGLSSDFCMFPSRPAMLAVCTGRDGCVPEANQPRTILVWLLKKCSAAMEA